MEIKINIAEILKDKPQGTKLYDLLRNIEVELDSISPTDYENIIWCRYNDVDPYDLYGYSTFGTERGWLNGLQILLPSKEMRDWSKLAWNTGDILVNKDGNAYVIFGGFDDDTYETFNGNNYLWKNEGITMFFGEYEDELPTSDFIKANKEYAQKYIHQIEKRLGYKLNLETLKIEKTQPEFKDGDILYCEGDSLHLPMTLILKILPDKMQEYAYINNKTYDWLHICCDKTLDAGDISRLRYATEEEKQHLFNALAKKGKAWDSEKKKVVNLKPKFNELKPFDKVVVFDELAKKWECGMFSHYSKNYKGKEVITCIGGCTYFKVLPFNEETAKLIGTTNDWEG